MVKTIFTTHVRVMVASTLAAAIHAAAFYGYSDHTAVSAVASMGTPLSLNIRFTVEPAKVEQLKAIEPLNKPASKSLETVQTVVKQNQPIKPKQQKQVPEADTRQVTQRPAEPVIQTADIVTKPLIVVEEVLATQRQEDRFINELLNQIENQKYYPKKARRKNIQGTVQVELKLDDNGNIVSLQLLEGHKILRKAAATAIHASAPFKAPPSSLRDPQAIKFGVHYQFR